MKHEILILLVISSLLCVRCENEPSSPQEPKPPYPYNEENVKISIKKANITLSGTLTIPKQKPIACAVLAHGSGGQNRDEKVGRHKIFKVIADYLTRNNIAVLRYDERGIGESTGNFSLARDYDFADDAIESIKYLKSQKRFKTCPFGIIGHSKGGITAQIAASKSDLLKYIVLIGSPGMNGLRLIMMQLKLILKDRNESDAIIEETVNEIKNVGQILVKSKNLDQFEINLIEYARKATNLTDKNEILKKYSFYFDIWLRDLFRYEPKKYLKNVKIPILGLWGSTDLQVPAKENLEGIKRVLKQAGNENKKSKLIILKNLNHLFQYSETGSPSDYDTIDETFNVNALKIITKWITRINRHFRAVF